METLSDEPEPSDSRAAEFIARNQKRDGSEMVFNSIETEDGVFFNGGPRTKSKSIQQHTRPSLMIVPKEVP